MEEEKSEPVEIPIELPKREGNGLCAVGIRGETDYASMKDREGRVHRIKDRDDYRQTVPCDRCANCLEFRGFSSKKGEMTLGLWCLYGEFETTPYNTCNQARLPRKERKKVVYDLRNAPIGFKEGLSRLQSAAPMAEERREVRPEVTIPKEGYHGGSEYYKRADLDKEAVGTGKMPKGLAN